MSKGKGITLSKDRGVNARMTLCPRCGKEGEELVLLGTSDYIHECLDCGAQCIHSKKSPKCKKCSGKMRIKRRLEEHERVPGSLCQSCKDSDKACFEVVKEGGIFWRCKACNSAGAIRKENPLCDKIRTQANILPPNPVGVEFDKDCPVCGAKENQNQA